MPTERQNARSILAANIGMLIQKRGGGTQMGLVKAAKVPQKTISRAKTDENAATLDTVNDIAHGLGLHPWQLLVPGLDPDNPPQLVGPEARPEPPQGGALARIRRRGGPIQPRIGAPARPRTKEQKRGGDDR